MSSLTVTQTLVVFLIAAALSAVLVHFAVRLALINGMLDVPGNRQSHTTPTATGGGIGIVLALVLASWGVALWAPVPQPWLQIILPGAVLLSLMGWLDDRRHIPIIVRLLVQLGVSFALIAFGTNMGRSIDWLLILPGVIAVVWLMNSYNFMDGSHGMAGFQGLFSGLLLGLVFTLDGNHDLAMSGYLLAACCLGFLPFNFPRPRIFMGDAGSVPLGFMLAGLMVLGLAGSVLSFPVALLVLAVFLVDSSLTLLSRVIRGEQWYTAHKLHMYQRLIAQGWPHSRVLLLYLAINIIFVAPVAILAQMYPEYAWQLAGMMFLSLSTGWYLASLRLGVRK
jgi:Fuc2NAc and GlcNAc transferase